MAPRSFFRRRRCRTGLGDQLLKLFPLFGQLLAFPADLHFLKPAQAAQAHVEDCFGLTVGERELSHEDRLRLVFRTDDFDDPIQVQVGDQEAIQQLQPVIDLADPDLCLADENFDLELQPGGKRLLQAHHDRRAVLVQNVEIEGEADLEVGQPVEAFLQQFGIHRACARLQDDPKVLGAFVPDVGQDRELLLGDELGDLLDQLPLLDAVRDLA